MKIGLLREGKNPPDKRTPLSPEHCRRILDGHPKVEIFVEDSEDRCFPLSEYLGAGCHELKDRSECDVLMGVKEVPIGWLIPNKTYFFFSHTAKFQEYNKPLLKACIEKGIRLVDYEYLTNDSGARVVAFGRWAGIVGAHNGLIAWGKRSGDYNLLPAYLCKDQQSLFAQYSEVDFPKMKILITGTGRVAHGARETLLAAGIRELQVEEYLNSEPDEAVFCMADIKHFYRQKFRNDFLMEEFFAYPEVYRIHFDEFIRSTDLMINAIYWDSKAPRYFDLEEMAGPDFRIRSIADITCDINGSVPCTHRPSKIIDPVYGWDFVNGKEATPYHDGVVDIMAVDNLPCELPVNASIDFGNAMLEHVLPQLFKSEGFGEMIERASICKDGALTERYGYLQDFLDDE